MELSKIFHSIGPLIEKHKYIYIYILIHITIYDYIELQDLSEVRKNRNINYCNSPTCLEITKHISRLMDTVGNHENDIYI